MFDAPPMDSHLRYDGKYEAKAWLPAVDFNNGGGIVIAIEQCNGQGVCRKENGVMCPSFQATKDEKFSTRGRANLLRSMITSNSSWQILGSGIKETGHLREDDLSASPRSMNSEVSKFVFESLDLCLACKGCKAECPSGVDMAKLKFAFMAEYYKSHHRLLRDYLFGYFHVTAGFLSSIAPIVNFIMGVSRLKSLVARSMSITAYRPFPRFTKKKAMIKLLPGSPKVLFLRDPFTHFIEPGIEQAAFNVLFSMGFDVEVITILGAGASLMSKGFIPAARHHAERILKELNKKSLTNFSAIVGIEPSELYFLKHDYLDLFPGRSIEIAEIASKTWLLEEFLIRSLKFNNLRIATHENKIFLHPHCHQKAEHLSDDGISNGTDATVEFLKKFGYEIELSEAGCCGMAGTFGYEKEHFDLSQQIGNLKLFPLVKKVSNDHLIAANGAACRMQIFQGTGVSAKHPIEFAELALRSQNLAISD
jgi:Fe-S oxidoreductase